MRVFPRRTRWGTLRAFAVTGQARDARGAVWLRARLPMRPNGSSGWIRAASVQLTRVDTRIEIQLARRRLVLFRGGRPVERHVIAVGAPATPTPTGRFFVPFKLVSGNPTDPAGPGAIALSAWSDVLQDWVGGGQIAIHGTSVPTSVGQPVSHGCLRLRNAELKRLFKAVPVGTPVRVTTS